jgi:hypothetical protein
MIFSGIGALLVIVGIIVFVIQQRSAAKQKASLTWPTCDGQVTRANIESGRDNEGRWTYSAHIAYAYAVNGQNHNANRVAWGGRASSGNVREAEAMIARYPVGSAVKVYYNPGKPGEAVLDPASKGGVRLLLFVAVAFVVIGGFFVALGPFIQE